MLIFGSTALKHWYTDFARIPKDLDLMGKGVSTCEVECHWVDGFQYIFDKNIDKKYVDPNFLYTIKISHAAWDIRWDKTMHDIHFMKAKGCVIDMVLYDILFKEWEIKHREKKVKLVGTANEFFKSTIIRKIDHDTLHQMIAFDKAPMHTLIRHNKNSVICSKSLWDTLCYEDQLKCALEEAYVFALERYYMYPAKIALSKAIKTLITSSTKGWFNLFLIDNHKEMLYYNLERYINLFNETKGKVYG